MRNTTLVWFFCTHQLSTGTRVFTNGSLCITAIVSYAKGSRGSEVFSNKLEFTADVQVKSEVWQPAYWGMSGLAVIVWVWRISKQVYERSNCLNYQILMQVDAICKKNSQGEIDGVIFLQWKFGFVLTFFPLHAATLLKSLACECKIHSDIIMFHFDITITDRLTQCHKYTYTSIAK